MISRCRLLLAGLVLFATGCGDSHDRGPTKPELFERAPAWARFHDGFHLRLSSDAEPALRWVVDDGAQGRHEGLFARIDGAWQADGSGIARKEGQRISIFSKETLLCRRSLDLPEKDFALSPRLAVGPDGCRLAWKLHGRLPLRVSWRLDGRAPLHHDVEGKEEDRIALPPGYHGALLWSLEGAGRCLARGRSRSGLREMARLPLVWDDFNLVEGGPVLVGEDVVVSCSQGYIAALRPEPTAEGTRFALRWLWGVPDLPPGKEWNHLIREIWTPGEGAVEMVDETGRIFRLDARRRGEIWRNLKEQHPEASPADLLRLPEARCFDGSRGEGVTGETRPSQYARTLVFPGETLLLLSPHSCKDLSLHRRAGDGGTWTEVGRCDGGAVLAAQAVDEARFFVVAVRPDKSLFLRSFERRIEGWAAVAGTDLGVKHEEKSNFKAHCVTLALPGRNLSLVGCMNRIYSVVTPPEGHPVVTGRPLPGSERIYVEGLVALSPHRAVALALEPRKIAVYMGEVTRKVSLVEIALEDPLKPALRVFTILGDNLRLQGSWHVKGAIFFDGDRLHLNLGSEVVISDGAAPFALRRRFAGFHNDRYFFRSALVGRRFLAFHRQSAVMGIDLLD